MRVRVVFGTRPEAIKVAPLIYALRKEGHEVWVVNSGQHTDLLDDLLPELGITVSFQGEAALCVESYKEAWETHLVRLQSCLFRELDEGFNDFPDADWTVVQGDTATACAAAQVAFLRGERVAHLEAGLRTHNLSSPFPEEGNRAIIGSLASLHLAPTPEAVQNLDRENARGLTVNVGNTVIDAARKFVSNPTLFGHLLVTAHRRENRPRLHLLAEVLNRLPDQHTIVVCHPHPGYRETLERQLVPRSNLTLLEPQGYTDYLRLIAGARWVLTDSGGTVEEASALKTAVIIWRDTTERSEALDVGHALMSQDPDELVDLLQSDWQPSKQACPFGNGRAAEACVTIMETLHAAGQ